VAVTKFVQLVKENQLPAMFLFTLVVGLICISAAAYWVNTALGLLVSGVCLIVGGHWVAYLQVNSGGER
jgi:hypothetical protein